MSNIKSIEIERFFNMKDPEAIITIRNNNNVEISITITKDSMDIESDTPFEGVHRFFFDDFGVIDTINSIREEIEEIPIQRIADNCENELHNIQIEADGRCHWCKTNTFKGN